MKETNSVANATRMTSLQIAEVTGKQHKNVLSAIRSMEPAWEKVTGLKFKLSEYTDETGRKLPCYSLTKTESLYIATKFNDEARARLILRWEELETSRPDNSELVLKLARSLYAANRTISSLLETVKMEHEASRLILDSKKDAKGVNDKLDFITWGMGKLVGYYLDLTDPDREMGQSEVQKIIESMSAGKEVSDERNDLPF